MKLDHLNDETIKEILMIQDRLKVMDAKSESRDSFLGYIKHVWPEFIEGEHHRLFAQKLEDVAKGKGPLNTMITQGMANWNASQLEEEIEHPHAPGMSWLMMDYDEKLVFGQLPDTKPNDIWEDCISRAIKNKTSEITAKIFKD